jgi:hypothetical protein
MRWLSFGRLQRGQSLTHQNCSFFFLAITASKGIICRPYSAVTRSSLLKPVYFCRPAFFLASSGYVPAFDRVGLSYTGSYKCGYFPYLFDSRRERCVSLDSNEVIKLILIMRNSSAKGPIFIHACPTTVWSRARMLVLTAQQHIVVDTATRLSRNFCGSEHETGDHGV